MGGIGVLLGEGHERLARIDGPRIPYNFIGSLPTGRARARRCTNPVERISTARGGLQRFPAGKSQRDPAQ